MDAHEGRRYDLRGELRENTACWPPRAVYVELEAPSEL